MLTRFRARLLLRCEGPLLALLGRADLELSAPTLFAKSVVSIAVVNWYTPRRPDASLRPLDLLAPTTTLLATADEPARALWAPATNPLLVPRRAVLVAHCAYRDGPTYMALRLPSKIPWGVASPDARGIAQCTVTLADPVFREPASDDPGWSSERLVAHYEAPWQAERPDEGVWPPD